MSLELTNECIELFQSVQGSLDSTLSSFGSKVLDNLIAEFQKLDKDMTNVSNNLNKAVLESEKTKNIVKDAVEKLKLPGALQK